MYRIIQVYLNYYFAQFFRILYFNWHFHNINGKRKVQFNGEGVEVVIGKDSEMSFVKNV